MLVARGGYFQPALRNVFAAALRCLPMVSSGMGSALNGPQDLSSFDVAFSLMSGYSLVVSENVDCALLEVRNSRSLMAFALLGACLQTAPPLMLMWVPVWFSAWLGKQMASFSATWRSFSFLELVRSPT